MTFEEVKAIILNNAKRRQICPGYQAAFQAGTLEDLITSSKSLLEWASESSIVTGDILKEFDQSILNANGIYVIGSHTLTTGLPTEIYVFGNATVSIDSTESTKVFGFDYSTINIISSGTSFIPVKTYGQSYLSFTGSDNITSCMELNHNADVTLNDNSISHIRVSKFAEVTLNLNNNSYAKVMGFGDSIITVVQLDDSEIDSSSYEDSTFTTGLP